MIEKEGNKTIVTGLVEDHVVDTYGGITYELQVDYNSIESLMRSYEGEKVRITIEVMTEEDSNEDDSW
ncbi:hypothetical protein [Rossellomorea marisflavi]|uniref:hypothetical protein n=1 Tax=Rossellomorea marisflavi TaxID=189381 RepID=UPI003F9F7F80